MIELERRAVFKTLTDFINLCDFNVLGGSRPQGSARLASVHLCEFSLYGFVGTNNFFSNFF